LLIFYIIFISLFSFYAIAFRCFHHATSAPPIIFAIISFDFRLLITRQPLLAADIRCHADAAR
jgi:hypothetical protein